LGAKDYANRHMAFAEINLRTDWGYTGDYYQLERLQYEQNRLKQ